MIMMMMTITMVMMTATQLQNVTLCAIRGKEISVRGRCLSPMSFRSQKGDGNDDDDEDDDEEDDEEKEEEGDEKGGDGDDNETNLREELGRLAPWVCTDLCETSETHKTKVKLVKPTNLSKLVDRELINGHFWSCLTSFSRILL